MSDFAQFEREQRIHIWVPSGHAWDVFEYYLRCLADSRNISSDDYKIYRDIDKAVPRVHAAHSRDALLTTLGYRDSLTARYPGSLLIEAATDVILPERTAVFTAAPRDHEDVQAALRRHGHDITVFDAASYSQRRTALGQWMLDMTQTFA